MSYKVRSHHRGAGRDNHEEGDWLCPDSSCNNLNFARRTVCNMCGCEKSSERANKNNEGSSSKKILGHEIGKAAAEKSKGLFSADDWQCGRCGNVNWARRSHCNMCNGPKFSENEERTGLGGGYNDRDQVEYIRRDDSDNEFDDFGRKKKKKSRSSDRERREIMNREPRSHETYRDRCDDRSRDRSRSPNKSKERPRDTKEFSDHRSDRDRARAKEKERDRDRSKDRRERSRRRSRSRNKSRDKVRDKIRERSRGHSSERRNSLSKNGRDQREKCFRHTESGKNTPRFDLSPSKNNRSSNYHYHHHKTSESGCEAEINRKSRKDPKFFSEKESKFDDEEDDEDDDWVTRGFSSTNHLKEEDEEDVDADLSVYDLVDSSEPQE